MARWQYKKQKVLAVYPFGLASENSDCLGYVTENLYVVLASGAIPVYKAVPDIADFVPEGSYINIKDFATYDDLIHHKKTVGRVPFYKWKEIIINGRYQVLQILLCCANVPPLLHRRKRPLLFTPFNTI